MIDLWPRFARANMTPLAVQYVARRANSGRGMPLKQHVAFTKWRETWIKYLELMEEAREEGFSTRGMKLKGLPTVSTGPRTT